MANSSNPWFSWRDQGSGSPTDLQLYTARPASADSYYFAHTLPTNARPPKLMPDYRMGDYAENTYFGPRQGPSGVWNGVNTSSTGFGRWTYGSGAPRALIDPAGGTRWLSQPIGFELLLTGPSSLLPSVSPLAVWKPIAPPGFTALGVIISPGQSHRPGLSSVRVLANECVAMCTAKQIWCDAKAPAGVCAPMDGIAGGWSTAAYMAIADAAAASAVRPMNVLWMAANRTDVVQTVPCVRSSCVASAVKTDDTDTIPTAIPGVPIFSPGMKVAATGEAIHTFRIPSLMRVGQTKTLLAFAEARKYSGSDFGPKALAMRRSTDLGASWQPLATVGPGWILTEGNYSFMNPNSIYDAQTKTVLLQFTYIQCDLDCKPPYDDCCSEKFMGHEAPSLFQISSTDAGLSWSTPTSLDDQLGAPGLTMGPGIGIQIPATGKLLSMGKGYALNNSFSKHDVVIASDDNGKSWRTAHIFNGTDRAEAGLDEPQLALLPNGNVQANMRHSFRNCPGYYSGSSCRSIATSTDQGETFGTVVSDGTLVSPICQGAILAGKKSVWFSNPASRTERANFTVRKSLDNTKTWTSKLISSTPGCGYSGMQFLSEDETVGFVWESDVNCTIRYLKVTMNGFKSDDVTASPARVIKVNSSAARTFIGGAWSNTDNTGASAVATRVMPTALRRLPLSLLAAPSPPPQV